MTVLIFRMITFVFIWACFGFLSIDVFHLEQHYLMVVGVLAWEIGNFVNEILNPFEKVKRA